MAKFQVTKDLDKQLTTFVVIGEVSLDETLEQLLGFYSGDPTPLAMWDLRQANVETFFSPQLESMVELMAQHIEKRKGGKAALLLADDLAFGLARMLETKWDILNLPLKLQTFRDHAKALKWLTSEP
jgi:hypothetical protein